MLNFTIAHVVATGPDVAGRCYAMTMINRQANGVIVWAGKLHPTAVAKNEDEICAEDYQERTTVSFMSWTDASEFFAGQVYEPLLDELIASAKQMRQE